MTTDALALLARFQNDALYQIMLCLPPIYLHTALVHHPDPRIADAAFAASYGKCTELLVDDEPDSEYNPGVRGLPACIDFLTTHRARRIAVLKLRVGVEASLIDPIKDLINAMDIGETHYHAFSIKQYVPTDRDVLSLLSIHSLTDVFIECENFKGAVPFASLPRLRKCRLDYCHVTDWSLVSWPSHLKDLRLITTKVDFASFQIPPRLEALYLSDFDKNLQAFLAQYVKSTDTLKTLLLDSTADMLIPTSVMPKTLVELELRFPSFRFGKLPLPPLLKRLYLMGAETDLSMPSDQSISWPPTLEYLAFRQDALSPTFHLPTLLRSLPPSLKTLSIDGFEGNLINPKAPRIELPPNLELLIFYQFKLHHVVFPRSIKEMEINCSDNRALQDYDSPDPNGPNWAQLVNLKTLSVCAQTISSLATWRPPPNLHTLDLKWAEILPQFPPELDSLHTLKTILNKRFFLKKIQLPANLQVWECLVDVRSFVVPRLMCNHPSLHTLRFEGEWGVGSIKFPQDFAGKLKLHILDLLGMESAPEYGPKNPANPDHFYDEIERTFGRKVASRPRTMNGVHLLTDFA